MSDSPDIHVFNDFQRIPDALLGTGAFGSVWRAKQLSVDRLVALKTLDRRTLAPTLLAQLAQRNQREANALARLKHRHIVGIYATGVKDGVPWMAMEYVDGGTLDDEIARRTKERCGFTELEIAKLGLAIAEALLAAKKQGVIHRDLKPTNVLLDREGQPVVTDFGMAKFLDAQEGAEKLTATGDVVGTPDYMAPEQIFPAEGRTVDHRADIYAFGALLYTLATLKPPLSGRSPYETMHKQLNTPPKAIRTTHPEYSETLERLILQALAKAPEERPSYEEIVATLQGIVEGDRPASVAPGVTPTPRRGARGAAIVIIAVVLAVFGAVWASRQPGADARSRTVADERKDQPRREEKPAPKQDDSAKKVTEPQPDKEARRDAEKKPEPPAGGPEPTPKPSVLTQIRAHRLNTEEAALLAELRTKLVARAPQLRARSYAAALEELTGFRDDARHTSYTRRQVEGAIELITHAQGAVKSRLEQFAVDAQVSIRRRDGSEIAGRVIASGAEAVTIRTEAGGEVSLPVADISDDDFSRDLRTIAAVAVRALAGQAHAELTRVVAVVPEDEEKALWLPAVFCLGDAEAAAAGLDEAVKVWDAILVRGDELVRLFAWLDGDMKRLGRERDAAELLRKNQLEETITRYPGTRAHDAAAERLIREFRAAATEDLLDGERAWIEWALLPDEGTVEATRRFWKGLKEGDQEYVWLCDMNGSHAIVPSKPVPTAPEGIAIVARYRAGEVDPAAHFRISFDAPGMRGAYLRIDVTSASLRRPLFTKEGEEDLRSASLADPGAGWRSFALVAGKEHLFFYADSSLALVMPKSESALGVKFAVAVVGSELVLKHVFVQPQDRK